MGEISPAQSACTFFQLEYNEFVGGDSTNHRQVRRPGEVSSLFDTVGAVFVPARLGVADCAEIINPHLWRCIVGNQIVSTEVKFLGKEILNATREVEFRLKGRLVLTAKLDELPEAVQLHSALFGLSQTLGDVCSGYVKLQNVAEAETALLDRYETLKTSWAKAEKGPRRAVPLEELIPIVSKLMGADMSAVLKAMTVAEANAVAAEKSVAAAVAADRAAKAKAAASAAPKSGLADLLGKLQAKAG